MSIVSELLSDRRQREHLNGKVSVSVDIVSEIPQGRVLAPLLFILYIHDLLHIVGNHIMVYTDATTIFAVIP